MFLALYAALIGSTVALRENHVYPRDMEMEARLAKARAFPDLNLRGTMWTPSAVPFFEHQLDHEIQFNDDVWMAWTADEANNLMTISVAWNKVGWLGLGPTETGSMIGLNPCVIRENPIGSGNVTIFAMHQHQQAQTAPVMNQVQNCKLLEYSVVRNESFATFTRPMIGCKEQSPPEDTDYTTRWDLRIAVAYGNDMIFGYHGIDKRATREVHIGDGIYTPLPLPDDVQVLDALLLPMYLPAYRDIYLCRGFYFPSDKRYHLIRMDPILPGNIYPAAYHHLLAFACRSGQLPEKYEDPNFVDVCPVIPDSDCMAYFTGWALGGPSLFYDIYGIPVGEGSRAPKGFLMQTHVDNPESSGDIFEPGWGMRMFYTPTLREISGGSFGMYSGTPLIGIPPQEESFMVQSECADSITSRVFPEGIYIDSVFSHMHGLGRVSKVDIIRQEGRDWRQLEPVYDADFYDTNWQGSRLLKRPGYFLAGGDRLRITCKYNTMSKNEPTRNGEGFDDEMCIKYINYYPVNDDLPPSICAEFPPGIGISFVDVPPYVGAVGSYEYEPYVPPADNCQA
jgi:hypothetical protein